MNHSHVYRFFSVCLVLASLALPSAWAQSFEEGGDVESIEAVQDGGDIQGGGGPTPTEAADWGSSGRIWLGKGDGFTPIDPPPPGPIVATPVVLPMPILRW